MCATTLTGCTASACIHTDAIAFSEAVDICGSSPLTNQHQGRDRIAVRTVCVGWSLCVAPDHSEGVVPAAAIKIACARSGDDRFLRIVVATARDVLSHAASVLTGLSEITCFTAATTVGGIGEDRSLTSIHLGLVAVGIPVITVFKRTIAVCTKARGVIEIVA